MDRTDQTATVDASREAFQGYQGSRRDAGRKWGCEILLVMHRFARTVGRRLLPALAADRAIAFERRLRHELGVDRVALAVEAVLGRTVIGGPFEGTVLGNTLATTAASPVLKLLGMYEPVLQPALEIALGRKPGVVANIGCADGYYAVGIARRLPAAIVHAYDLASSARALTRDLAVANRVDQRVVVHGRCRRFPADVALVLCDIEGGESRLLVPGLLRSAVVIVETHDEVVPGVTRDLCERFEATHLVEELRRLPIVTPPVLDWLPEVDRRLALDELRSSEQSWLALFPR